MKSYILKMEEGNFLKIIYRLFLSLMIIMVFVLFTGFMHARKIVTVIDDEERVKFLTIKTDINDILRSKDINVFDKDVCNIEDDGHDITVTIKRAVNVKLVVGAERKNVLINPCAKVSDVLKECGVELGPYDIISCSNEDVVYNGMEILINRVSYVAREEIIEIDFKKEITNTNKLCEGQTQIQVVGQKGEIRKGYVDKFVDGKLVEISEKYSNVVKSPVDEVVLKGTKRNKQPIVKKDVQPVGNGAPAEYKKMISGKASAYSGGGFTSTGRKAARGLVAVDPRKIPYGTRLYISSPSGYVYGYAVAADCGSMMVNGSRVVDLYMDTERECQRFGVREVNIYIL